MKISSPKKTVPKRLIPGSKVAINVLLDYISEGYSVAEFLADYPWIKKGKISKVLDELKSEKYPASYAF